MTNVHRLGEVQDDYCTSCHLLLSHDIASVVNGEIAKTTCRTCFNTHDYKHGKIPKRPAKKVDSVDTEVIPKAKERATPCFWWP